MKRTFRKVAKIALILVYIVIIAGAVVRMTGSGMGCPDWPKCFGYYIPPTNAETLQWQPNRDFKKGQAIIKDSTLLSLFLFKTDKKLTYITILTLIVLAVQALLGKIVVDTNLKTGMITVHMVIAFVLIALLLLVIYRSGNQNNILEKLNPSIKNLILITTVITLLQVILGTQVREFIDQQIDLLGEQSKNLWLEEPALKFYVHRSFSIVIIALNLILAVKMVRIYPHYKKIKWVMIFILLSVLTGIAMNYADFPFASQPLHLVLAALLFGVQFYMVLEGIMPFKSHKTS